MAKAEECLFLLEVLIDKIIFIKSPCFSDKNFKTCVSFDFLSLAPLEICDDEREGCAASFGGPYIKDFNSGKSCLFALKQPDIDKAMTGFPITVTVFKALPCDCLPTKIVMGTCSIDMTKQFSEARTKYLDDPESVSYQSLKDSFRLVAPDNSETGDLLLFMRISCFGKIIITKFQGGGGGIAGAMQASASKSCNPKKEFRAMDDPCYCGPGRSQGGGGGGASCGGGGGASAPCPTEQETPCMDGDDPCFCTGSGPKAPATAVACRNTEAYCLHVPKGACCPPGNRIVFQVPADSCNTGHRNTAHLHYTSDGVGDLCREDPADNFAPSRVGKPPAVVYDFQEQVIKLRVGKTVEMPGRKTNFELQFVTPEDGKKPKAPPIWDSREAQCVEAKKGKKKIKCGKKQMCSAKPFEEIGATFNGNEVKIRVPKKTKKSKLLTPSEEGLLQRCTCDDDDPACPTTCGGDGGGGGGPRNQMIFQVPDDMCTAQEHRTPLNSELAYCRRETPGVKCDVTPRDAPRGVRASKMRHPDHDVFVLQIGKQTDEPSRESNIEVELVTPRAPPPHKPPTHSCKQIQAIVEAKPAGKKKKKGKGKKKK